MTTDHIGYGNITSEIHINRLMIATSKETNLL